MSLQPARNIVASIHQRLLNLAQPRGENFQDVLRSRSTFPRC